nr:YesK-like family protein [Bacillus pseudomycoides]
MNGFEVFFIIGAVTILIVFAVSFLLKKQFPKRPFDIIFALILILLCLAFFPFTIFAIGGWNGLWYCMFLCFSGNNHRYDYSSICKTLSEKLCVNSV